MLHPYVERHSAPTEETCELRAVYGAPAVQHHVFGIGSDRWPDGPPLSGVAQESNLIPVSGVGETVGGVNGSR